MNKESNKQEVGTIVAEVAQTLPEAAVARSEHQGEPQSDPRVDELERRIRELEAAIGDLRTVSASGSVQNGRKTQAAYAPRLLAKGAEPVRAGDVDAALGSLSLEQRIAVKAGLLRAGLL